MFHQISLFVLPHVMYVQLFVMTVAVGNGCDLAKNAADIAVQETSTEGGAGIAIEVLAQL